MNRDTTKQNIVDYLTRNKHVAWIQQTIGWKGRKLPKKSRGIGDIVACIRPRGTHLEVELKREGDEMRPAQYLHGGLIQQAGGWYIVVRDFDDFLDKFQTIQKMT